jgi:hypothetical protein
LAERVGGVLELQTALLSDPTAPAAVVPLFNLEPQHPQWQAIQTHYLNHPNDYPANGYHPAMSSASAADPGATPIKSAAPNAFNRQISIEGLFYCKAEGQYELYQKTVKTLPDHILLLTVRSEITALFLKTLNAQQVHILGIWNSAGKWLLCEQMNRL